MPDPIMNPIEAGEKTLATIFSDQFAFEIPSYQRPYAWQSEQAGELLDDLLDAMDNQAASGGVYFLGSIVLIKQPGLSAAKVVDGQQRLTTLTILISVLRDLTTDIESKIDRGSYVHQKESRDRGTDERFRLSVRERDQLFFAKHIQVRGATKSLPQADGLDGPQALMISNAKFYHEALSKLDEDRRDKLFAFMMQRCFLVVVAVPTADAARRIFTVLNARGMDLTATDILKADLLERAGRAQEQALASRWEEIELSLGRDDFVELFGHIRMVYQREKPRSALEKGFLEFVTSFKGDPGDFISDTLEPFAEALSMLAHPHSLEERFGKDVVSLASSLQRIDNKDWMPPAMLKLKKASMEDGHDVQGFFKKLERVAYFLFTTRADVNVRMKRYADIMEHVDTKSEKPPKTTGLELSNEDQARFITALDGPIYKKGRVCKPLLLRLDTVLSGGGATYDNVVSIEHVLPQTVKDGSEWAKLFAEDLRSKWTHRLANLIILTRRINSRASNWDFEKKKEKYFQAKDGRSPFPVTQEVLEEEEWDIECLERRQLVLLTKLATEWELGTEDDIIAARLA